MRIGVLALQGAVDEHLAILRQLGVETLTIKQRQQLEQLDGLVIPGGESTAISKLMRTYGLLAPLQERAQQGFPIMGTCAGLILLAQQVVDGESHLGVLNVTVRRNAFGRQRDSFEQSLMVRGMDEPFPAVFIRAPLIERVGQEVEVLASVDKQIVAVRERNLLGLSFHPELTDDVRFHKRFIDIVQAAK